MDYIIQDVERFLILLDDFFQCLKNCGTYNPFRHDDERAKLLFAIALNLCNSSNCIDKIRKMMNELNKAKEKILDLELRRGGWKMLIPSCFGDQSGTFNGNTLNNDIANKIRKIVKEENIDIGIVLQEFKQSLDNTFPKKTIKNEQEMKKVEKFFKG